MLKITRFTLLLLLSFSLWNFQVVNTTASSDWRSKVDELVFSSAEIAETEFIVYLSQQADLSNANTLATKTKKGAYIFNQLTQTAKRTQTPLLSVLSQLNVEHRPFWIVNAIWVRGNIHILQLLAQRQDIAHIFSNPKIEFETPALTTRDESDNISDSTTYIEWNISKVRAPEVWSAGFTGQNVVIAGQDTGYDWDHPALKTQYRGWDGSNADHNYNWHDAIHNDFDTIRDENICGFNSVEPCDDHGHGTHTMGTMVGDDGAGYKMGMAPGARWIGCRNMEEGVGTPATYMECFQWFLAPTDLNDQNPDPGKAPHVINNSWTCPLSGPDLECEDAFILQDTVDNVRKAGIVVVVAAGNEGPACNTVDNPPAIYESAFSVGATDANDNIASFSSIGPSDHTDLIKPNVTAPGQSIRSSTRGGGYGYSSGTSMAAPHVAGLVALLISAKPSLANQVEEIESHIKRSAVPLEAEGECGGIGNDEIPNNTFGWGRINAWNALLSIDPMPIKRYLPVIK